MVEVEAQQLSEVDDAVAAGADTILVDNMTLDDIRDAVRRTRGVARVEISGGVTLPRITELAATGAEYVSSGALDALRTGRRHQFRDRAALSHV